MELMEATIKAVIESAPIADIDTMEGFKVETPITAHHWKTSS